ncbi:MAG: MBL fold metallo-hydrolase [Prevotellaceae bacterium]|jgi:metallo-beta-lactamase family protein|nr:MBL fold metallo-hydrolase [Prevotellaceae bacterium]
MKIEFIGAAQEVTGSKHLLTTDAGKRILLDCGMFQGKGLETDAMNRHLGFDPTQIDHLILSHAHIDHSGLIPYIYKKGFRGSVITTAATRDLCALMLADSAFIQELDAKYYNKKAARKHLPLIKPIYQLSDAERCMDLFVGIGYNYRFHIDNTVSVQFFNAGHMLGSAVVCLEVKEWGKTTRIAFTGDIGRPENALLRTPEAFPQCDYLISEATYGNRLHVPEPEVEQQLTRIVHETCVEKGGKLLIPSFSVGRTQEIVFVLNKLYNEHKLPHIDVFVDSPLSMNATNVFRLYTDSMNDSVKHSILFDDDPFGFNSLHYIKNVEDSKALNSYDKPCIIIAASGMLEAGRIKHHVSNNIANASTTILIVGYCTPTSLGARLQQKGLKTISIFGEEHPVRAKIEVMEVFSGHADYAEMIAYLRCQDPKLIRQTFLVHGDPDVLLDYREKLKEQGFGDVVIPAPFNTFEIG